MIVPMKKVLLVALREDREALARLCSGSAK